MNFTSSNNDIFDFTNLFFRCHSFDYGDTGAEVCRLSHHSKSTLMQIEEPYLEAVGATTYELGACYNVTVECKVMFLNFNNKSCGPKKYVVHTE